MIIRRKLTSKVGKLFTKELFFCTGTLVELQKSELFA
jgi:hypothetical protein